ncbi:PQQ-binding-like beta-propeller repeat protein [Streptomyces sp. SYP-A7185]|uniref:outer membrane protein assembly factor BamB family protein n=1 Tax=Streptomyces sp. SYP-A7185 TaxID=3040076 RepID=UPI0038F70E28
MSVVPFEVTAAEPVRPVRARRGSRLALPVALGLLALPLITAAHHSRPAPYGDHLTVHARVADGAADPALRTRGGAVQAYDPATGHARWTHRREGARPLALLPAPGHAVALWSDGMVTDTARADGSAVRWHRAIPGGAPWLRSPAARGGAGVLRPLDPRGRMLAVVTPRRIAAYRSADGDLRWVLPARDGCAFDPARAVRRGGALMLAQPCGGAATPWTAQLIAVDDLGRIVPRRTPLGNELPGGAPGDVRTRAEKELASPR